MDPWGFNQSKTGPTLAEHPPNTNFEDNFAPALRHTLPDSDQYLASLEAKLRKIKNDPDVLKQLSQKREACLQNLLNGEIEHLEIDEDLEAPVSNYQILRTIAPQKQALSKGEIVELIQHDHLNESENDELD